MARMKKATAKKAAPKKTVKKTPSKRQAPKEELAPVPTQQNPQPPMGTPPMGANGPMMRKGGKIKKMRGGGPAKDTTKVSYETSPYTQAKQNKATGVVIPKKNEKEEFTYIRNSEKAAAKKALAGKKSQGGTKFGALSVKAGVDDNYGITAADRISGAKMNKGKAKSGTKIKKAMNGYGGAAASMVPMKKGGTIKKAMMGKTMMKMGGSIKKAQGGTLETPPSRIQSTNQKVQSNVNKIAMKNAGDSLQKSAAGTAKSGKSMKKCKYGCK